MNTVFVYSLNGEVKCHDDEGAIKNHLKLIHDGWKHTATLEPHKWIENLCNSRHDEILSEIDSLKAKTLTTTT